MILESTRLSRGLSKAPRFPSTRGVLWDRAPAGPAQRVPLLAFAPKICDALGASWKQTPCGEDHLEAINRDDHDNDTNNLLIIVE